MSLPGISGSFGTKEIRRTFDNGNRPAVLRLPDGIPFVQRLYDDGSRLSGIYRHQNQPQLGVPGSGEMLWSAEHAGSRMTGITRGNGLVTNYHYDAQGRPIDVTTGMPDINGDINDAVHHLGFSWTEASLRRSKTRNDLNRVVENFHYDEVGHLESDTAAGIPAIAEADADLAALTAMTPKTLKEWWTVNRVDELTTRNRTLEGRQEAPVRMSNDLHQVEWVGATRYYWDVNGNLESRGISVGGGDPVIDATYTHDWRDRLVNVEQGSENTKLIIDPLGRLVAKVSDLGGGEVNRVYLHDGDQVVAEYVQEAGGSSYQLERRHHWGNWIDQLVAEEVDTDRDGMVETTLYPLTDMLGSVQLLTDEQGDVVERIEYDADGTPRFFAADTVAPNVTRVAWTGDGVRPNGDIVAADVFEIGFSEIVDEASVADAAMTLTPNGGTAVDLTITFGLGGRSALLSGVTPEVGVGYTLNVAGLKDRGGNAIDDVVPVMIADAAVYEVVSDSVGPRVLAVLDGSDGLYVVLDEPVMNGSLAVERNGNVVDGVTARVSGQVVKWTPDAGDWLVGGEYVVVGTSGLEDLNGQDHGSVSASFTHLAMDQNQVLVVYSDASESAPLSESAYGVTSLFQGRGWHGDLDLYYYRARWYSPSALSYLERDPLEYVDGLSLYQPLRFTLTNLKDPTGQTSRTDIRDNRLFYTWHMGWLDRSHASDPGSGNMSLRIAWLTIRSAPAGATRTIKLSQDQSKPGNVAYKKQSIEFKVRIKSSESERANQLMYAWQLVSGAFEDYQHSYPQTGGLTTWLTGKASGEEQKVSSGFSTEDLVSDLVAFYAIIKEQQVDTLLSVAGRLDETREIRLSYLVWDQYLKPSLGGAPSSWRPRYPDLKSMIADGDPVVMDYYTVFGYPHFPHEFEEYWPSPDDVFVEDENRGSTIKDWFR